ncbi:MAG: hypothetical protein ACM3ST_10855 [Bdellovibrio bacteriovorus]
MSFDTLTIAGILSSILSGGFLIALASRNGGGRRDEDRLIAEVPETLDSRP